MSKVLTCAEFDTEGACVVEVWADPQPMLPAMPTIAQATLIGGAMLAALVTLTAMKLLLQPPRDLDD